MVLSDAIDAPPSASTSYLAPLIVFYCPSYFDFQ